MLDYSASAVEAPVLQEKCFTTSDADEWRRYLPARQSVFGSVEYASICESFRGYVPRLFVMESELAFIAHPLLLRPVSNLPFASGIEGMWDASTPEFTGPFLCGSDEDLSLKFRARHTAFAQAQGITSEFAHIHPWADGRRLLGAGCVFNRDIVWIDVTQNPEQIFEKDLDRSCRNKIRKAQRGNIRIVADPSDEAVNEFHRIYLETMRRTQALESYHFPLEFFRKIRDDLPENARFVLATHDGRTAAAYLYLHDDDNVFSFLGGTDTELSHVAPTNLVVWDTVEWAHAAGKKRFILGAGYKPNDGVFHFKASFSPLRKPFYVCKRIQRPDDFALLDRRFREHNGMRDENVDYFPPYRYVPH